MARYLYVAPGQEILALCEFVLQLLQDRHLQRPRQEGNDQILVSPHAIEMLTAPRSRPSFPPSPAQPSPALVTHSTVSPPLPLHALLRTQPLLLPRRPRPQLQRMDAALPLQLLLQQRIHHAVPRGLHLGLERRGCDEHAEMRLVGC